MEKKLYNFRNTVNVSTDNMGSFKEQWVPIGYEHYKENDSHVDGTSYYSFDEVDELYNKGLTSKNLVKEDDKFYLRKEHLSAITVFKIINGIAPLLTANNKHLAEYAKKIGLLYDNPIPIKMHAGTKFLEIDNEDYLFTYKLNTDVIANFDLDYLEKLCVGTIKKIANKGCNYHDGIVYKFNCKSVSFDRTNLELKIITNKQNAIKDEFINIMRTLDMEIFIMFGANENKMVYFNAVMAMVRDMSQNQWINEENIRPDKDDRNNLYWYDKSLPE